MKTIKDLISEQPFFQNFPPEFIETIAGCGKNVHLDAGAMMATEGQDADSFYVLRRGVARIQVHLPAQGTQTIQTVGANSIIGWSWLFPPYQWNYDVVVVDDVSAIAFDGRCLRQKCDDNPNLGYTMVKAFAAIMVDRLKATRLRCLDIYGSRHDS